MTDINIIKDRWQLLLDKVNAPYFTNEEFEEFINMASLSFINKHSDDFERTDKSLEDFNDLIQENFFDSDDNGTVSNSDIETAIGSGYMYVANVSYKKSCGEYGLVRFCRHNDYYKMMGNSFKKPTNDKPVYRQLDDSIVVSPMKPWKIGVTTIKQPNKVSIDNNVNLDFDERTSMKIINIALALAGIMVDETELYQIAGVEEEKLG